MADERLNRSQQTGFTLLEVLVAMAITAFIGAIAYLTFNASMEAAERSQAQAERLNEFDRALQFLQRDLQQALPRPVFDQYGEQQSALIGGELAASLDSGWGSSLDSDIAGRYLLQLTRDGWLNPLKQQRSDLVRVAYRFDPDKGVLWRDYWAQLDRPEQSDFRTVELLTDIEALEIRFLTNSGGAQNNSTNRLGGSWQTQWPVGESNNASEQLPLAVELTIKLEGWGEITRLFPLPATG